MMGWVKLRLGLPERLVPSYGRRLPGIEGLRALAASSVLVFHVWIDGSPEDGPVDVGFVTRLMPDLAFGVTLFFTLSGFLLYRPFVAALLRSEHQPSIGRYLRNRALRIVPAYWAILLVSALVLRTVLVRDPNEELVPGSITSPELLAKHALLLQHYEPETVATGIGPAWSLAVEAVFYLALPLLVLLAFFCARRARSRATLRLAALSAPLVLLVLGLVGKVATAVFLPTEGGLSASWYSVATRSFLCQADLFSFGMAVAVLRVEAEDGRLLLRGRRRLAVAAAALAAYAVTAKSTDWNQLSESPFGTLMALACALLLALVVLPPSPGRTSKLAEALEWRPLVVVGLVSYSLFLWHEPLVFWLRDHGLTMDGTLGFAANIAIVGGVAFALSVASYRLVELPALRRKVRTSPIATAEVPVEVTSAAP